MGAEKLSLLELRVIQAQAVVPVIKAMAEKIGLDEAKAVVQKVNEEASRDYGRQKAAELGKNSMADLAAEVSTWGQGGSLEEEPVEKTDRVYAFNVTRCRYAEEYQRLGLGEFGQCLSCCRDEPFAEGFNPKIKFTRTKTIMAGDPICDFRYELID